VDCGSQIVSGRRAGDARSARSRGLLGWGMALVAAIVLTAAGVMFLYHPAQPARSIRAVIDPPEKTTFT